MGLLDDAIREHLDLKRRRGADPGEVERAEREALGPVRRGQAQPEPGEAGADENLVYDEEAEEYWGEPFDDEAEEFVPSPEPEHEPPAPEKPPRRGLRGRAKRAEPVEPLESDEPADDTRDAATPAPHPAAAPPGQSSDPRGGETVEYQVDEDLEPEGEKSEDVLEETPEFLQDTPDHDRLWFEQRPPRDFDFDG
jgi:hypothetical protein